MGERKRIIFLISIMAAVSLTISGIAIFLLYRTALEEEMARLVETAQSQARLIEAVARFDAVHNRDYPEGPDHATLAQLEDAHKNYKGFGKTGEFTLARRVGDSIVFLLSRRHSGFQERNPISFDSHLAEPMRRALLGESGTVVDLDYRGETVLAAHEPVQVLNLGIVAKIDMAEVQKPFIRDSLIALFVAILLVTIGAGLFLRISNPIINVLKERSNNLTNANEKLRQEIEERKQVEEALRESENRYRTLTALVPVGIYLTDEKGRYQYVNDRWCEMTGMSQGEAWGDGWIQGLQEDDRQLVSSAWKKIVESGGEWGLEYRFQTQQGRTTFTLGLARPLRDMKERIVGFIGANLDITHLKEAEEQLRVSLEEKDILLKEVHHRVKNNLQIVSSLLNMSAMQADSQQAKDLMQDARDKVFTMALIHAQLYQKERFDKINMGTHTRQLVAQLAHANKDNTVSIDTVVEPSDVYLTLNQAIPCGLVMNELITNAFKHAFKDKKQGTIEVSLRQADDQMVTIKVVDDGIGVPGDMDEKRPNTLGLELVDGLVKQLLGTIQFKKNNGTEVKVEFKPL